VHSVSVVARKSTLKERKEGDVFSALHAEVEKERREERRRSGPRASKESDRR